MTPWTAARHVPLPMGILQARILLQGVFLTQGSNLGLLHYRQILYHLSHQGSLQIALGFSFLWLSNTPLCACTHIHMHMCIHTHTHTHTHTHIHSSVQSLSCVRFFATPWTTACQASLSFTNSRSLLKLMSMELVMPSNHLILCRTLLLLPSTLPRIRVYSNESVICIRWPKYWSFSFSISPSNEYSGLTSFRMD